MAMTRNVPKLTDEAALALVQAAARVATEMGVPQCSAVVDEGCNLLAFLRMDGSRVLSIGSAQRKAETPAATGRPSGEMDPDVEIKPAIASGGRMTNLKGG
jgi:uncharacterized protein GlcG (DUF336 family)